MRTHGSTRRVGGEAPRTMTSVPAFGVGDSLGVDARERQPVGARQPRHGGERDVPAGQPPVGDVHAHGVEADVGRSSRGVVDAAARVVGDAREAADRRACERGAGRNDRLAEKLEPRHLRLSLAAGAEPATTAASATSVSPNTAWIRLRTLMHDLPRRLSSPARRSLVRRSRTVASLPLPEAVERLRLARGLRRLGGGAGSCSCSQRAASSSGPRGARLRLPSRRAPSLVTGRFRSPWQGTDQAWPRSRSATTTRSAAGRCGRRTGSTPCRLVSRPAADRARRRLPHGRRRGRSRRPARARRAGGRTHRVFAIEGGVVDEATAPGICGNVRIGHFGYGHVDARVERLCAGRRPRLVGRARAGGICT